MSQEIWQKTLSPNEVIKYDFTIGERYRKLCMIEWIVIGLLFMFFPPLGIFIILLSVFLFGWYLKKANVYAFTNKRVLIHRGWLNTELVSIDYGKITDVTVKEKFLDRLVFKTGQISINTAGTTFTEVVLNHLEKPYEIKKKLDEIRETK
jgi:membrane protein YdbS with pleckstrin-like domain